MNPNHPNQRMITPSVTNAMLCPGIAFGLPSAELPDARAEQNRAREAPRERLVVDDGRTGEILHAQGEGPPVGAPDPVRDDGVDEVKIAPNAK